MWEVPQNWEFWQVRPLKPQDFLNWDVSTMELQMLTTISEEKKEWEENRIEGRRATLLSEEDQKASVTSLK